MYPALVKIICFKLEIEIIIILKYVHKDYSFMGANYTKDFIIENKVRLTSNESKIF